MNHHLTLEVALHQKMTHFVRLESQPTNVGKVLCCSVLGIAEIVFHSVEHYPLTTVEIFQHSNRAFCARNVCFIGQVDCVVG